MKLDEFQTKVEIMQNDMTVIYETINAIHVSLDTKVLNVDQIGFAMIGVMENIEQSINNAGKLVDEIIRMRKVLDEI